MEFSHELALSLIQSAKPFPIDFEQGWQWLGYSSKHKAKEKLKRNFEETIDFEVFTQMVVNSTRQAIQGGRPSEKIFLSIDCFKSLGMMAGTSKGKEVRQYFLKCEHIAKQAIETIPAQSQEIERLKLELQLAQAQATAAQSQERLMQVSSAIVTMHGAGMLGLILGKPEAIVESPPIVVEKNILVDRSGKPVRTYEGLSKTKLARRYGMKKPQELVNWLQSMGKEDWVQPAMTAAPCQYVPFEYVPELDRLWAARQGNRQKLLGE